MISAAPGHMNSEHRPETAGITHARLQAVQLGVDLCQLLGVGRFEITPAGLTGVALSVAGSRSEPTWVSMPKVGDAHRTSPPIPIV